MEFLNSIISVWRFKNTRQRSHHCRNQRRLSLEGLEVRNMLSTISVLNLNDSGAGSLRQAIVDANVAPGADIIEFNVAGTIELTSGALPVITDRVDIDGTTAPGFAGTPMVEIDANGFNGLRFNQGSHDSTLLSLGIVDAGSAGVTLRASHVTLLGNFIGVELDGQTVAGNDGDGVAIRSSGNIIGGTLSTYIVDPVEREIENAPNRNVISGNGGNGIGIYGTRDNKIIANYIGTDSEGMEDLGNQKNGILLTKGASFNEIGGRDPLPTPPPKGYSGKPTEGNVISGNERNGVLLTKGAHHNSLSGNFIGTDVSGNVDVGNTLDGVAIVKGSDHNSLLGADPALPLPSDEDAFTFYNVVSGNDGNGLRIDNSDHTVVIANFFGMAADNGIPDPNGPILIPILIGNGLDGVLIEGTSTDIQFGGPLPLGNVVAANGKHGIEVRDKASGFVSGNTFSGMGAFNNSDAFGNALDGLHITSTGGGHDIFTSLFGANGDDGIEISGNASGVVVRQSIIGLNGKVPPGLLPLPNGDNGVEIGGQAHGNFIGPQIEGPSVVPQNTISANTNYGVAIIGNAHHNKVFGAFIGVNIEGGMQEGPVGNGKSGVFLGDHSHHNTIGGYREDKANLISGNGGHGVELSGATHDNKIIDNLIGSDQDGDSEPGFGNAGAGVFLSRSTHNNHISGNLARDNVLSGYELNGSRFNLFRDNQAIGNGGDGFLVKNSNFNAFIKNVAEDNSGDGFHVVNSKFNLFFKNESDDNDGFGFYVDKVFTNLFWGN